MLRIALRTLRGRWTTLVAAFAALVMGVALTAVMGLALAAIPGTPTKGAPPRYPGPAAVVRGPGAERALAAVARLGETEADRVFYAQPRGVPGTVTGRPWPAAALASFRIFEGRAPLAGDEVAVGGAGPAAMGPVTVLTLAGPRKYRVVGLVGGAGEPSVFFSGGEAARLSPRIDALVTTAPVDAVRRTVGPSARVLTGGDQNPEGPERRTLDGTAVLLGISGGVAGFVVVFVVASTFALSVSRRRGEFALLRLAGATARQVRRMLFAESALVGAVASAVGCLVALPCAPPLGRWLVREGLAPDSYEVAFRAWPLAVAFAVGMTVSLLGVWTAARRAGRIRPVEALRETGVEAPAMSVWRMAWGAAAFGWAFWQQGAAVADPASATGRKHYILVIMLLVFGCAMVAPLAVRPVTRLLTWPLGRWSGAGATIVRNGAVTSARRTAVTAVPVLVAVGLAAGLLGTTAMVADARAAGLRAGHRADLVIEPDGTPGLNREVQAAVGAVPGVDVTVRAATEIRLLEADGSDPFRAEAVSSAGGLGLSVLSGSPADLDDGSVIAPGSWGRRPGDRVEVLVADGARRTLRVVAVIRPAAGEDGVVVTLANAGPVLADSIDVRLRPGTDPVAALAALRTATSGLGARPVPLGSWLAHQDSGSGRHGRLGMDVMVALALLYCSISAAGTLAMTTADRRPERAVLRLVGATTRQVVGFAAAEAVLVIAVGAVLGAVAAGLGLAGMWVALSSGGI